MFGSVARGTSTSDSDLDLVVVVPDSISLESMQEVIDVVVNRVGRWTGSVCNVYLANDRRLAELVEEEDVMVSAWERDAVTFHGTQLSARLRCARSHM
jgi:predicted nucleotidyltransferase